MTSFGTLLLKDILCLSETAAAFKARQPTLLSDVQNKATGKFRDTSALFPVIATVLYKIQGKWMFRPKLAPYSDYSWQGELEKSYQEHASEVRICVCQKQRGSVA